MAVFKCSVCGRTDETDEGLFFYFYDDKAWCDLHVPGDLKKLIESL
jgi:hypothetical protein